MNLWEWWKSLSITQEKNLKLSKTLLKFNQLTGDIPQEVCDLIENNNLDLPHILGGNNLTNTCD